MADNETEQNLKILKISLPASSAHINPSLISQAWMKRWKINIEAYAYNRRRAQDQCRFYVAVHDNPLAISVSAGCINA